MRTFLRCLLYTSLLVCSVCHAHQPSESYLTLHAAPSTGAISGEWQIALRDLEHAIEIDTDADGAITWSELKSRRMAVADYAFSRLRIDAAMNGKRSRCPLELRDLLVDEHVGGHYAVLRFAGTCAVVPSQLDLRYSLLFDLDPNHRGLLNVDVGGRSQAFVLSPDANSISVELDAHNSSNGWPFVKEGVWHIWQGYDHILFLLTLLIPAVVLYGKNGWQPRDSLRSSVIDVTKVVTAFTVAHSLSLALAVYGWVHLPSRWIESAIALTVLLGALNNLFPLVRERRWLVAFIFGSIHGLAFAAVLTDLGLGSWSLFWALIGFNAGVELGQLAIVIVFVPIAYRLRATLFYRRAFIPAGALSIGVLAGYWLVARVLGI